MGDRALSSSSCETTRPGASLGPFRQRGGRGGEEEEEEKEKGGSKEERRAEEGSAIDAASPIIFEFSR